MNEDVIFDVFNEEIARELLTAINESITDDEVKKIWEMCKGNPWDAPIIYKILKMDQNENERKN